MTHYRVLGVEPSAGTAELRRAYRRLARVHHPDRRNSDSSDDMVRINEAWRVLSDPQRRQRYDASLGDGIAVSPPTGMRPSTVSPARFPWRFVLGFVVAATAAILLIGALSDADSAPIDNIVRVGSCVDIDERIREAWEVPCDQDHDAQVSALVPFDGQCPGNTQTFRDRQGLGLVCTGER